MSNNSESYSDMGSGRNGETVLVSKIIDFDIWRNNNYNVGKTLMHEHDQKKLAPATSGLQGFPLIRSRYILGPTGLPLIRIEAFATLSGLDTITTPLSFRTPARQKVGRLGNVCVPFPSYLSCRQNQRHSTVRGRKWNSQCKKWTYIHNRGSEHPQRIRWNLCRRSLVTQSVNADVVHVIS